MSDPQLQQQMEQNQIPPSYDELKSAIIALLKDTTDGEGIAIWECEVFAVRLLSRLGAVKIVKEKAGPCENQVLFEWMYPYG